MVWGRQAKRKERQTVDTGDAIRRLEREFGMSDTTQVTTLRGTQETEDGGYRKITVEVLDAGEGAGSLRYAVSVRSEDGGEFHGNPAGTLEEAISNASAHAGG
jgi:hypothetical protein